MNSKNEELGRTLKRQRAMMDLSLTEVSERSDVSASHLGRIERGERFPSARILRKIAKALELDENELFVMANFLSPEASGGGKVTEPVGRVDPYVAMVLGKEPVEVQRKVVTILSLLKDLAKGMT